MNVCCATGRGHRVFRLWAADVAEHVVALSDT